MLVFPDALAASDLPQGVVATIGNYDGVHRGQRAILERVVERARALSLPSAVVTFEPHPLAILRPEAVPPRLTTAAQKQQLLEEAGIDLLLVLRFTKDFAATPAERFVRDFLAAALGVRELYVGAGFVFGRQREGGLDLLLRVGAELGFSAGAVPEVTHEGRRISSTRIRQAVLEGKIEAMTAMLGRPYAITGTVARGDRMGKKLGWPTLNLAPENELLPADGVYAGRAAIASFETSFACATNVGTRPTVYENFRRVVESHLLDFSAEIYGQRAEIAFHRRLRDEQIFPHVMALSAQIKKDVDATREYFAQRERSLPGTTVPTEDEKISQRV